MITAVAASRLGLRCRILSGLSPAAVLRLRKENVRVSNVRRPEEPYALSAALSTRDNRSFVTYNGINDSLEERLLEPSRRASARHVHFAFYPADCARWEAVVGGLRRRGVTTSWDFGWNEGLLSDPGFEPLLRALDYVSINEGECLLYARESRVAAAVRYWQASCRNVLVKLGPQGCKWITPAGRLRAPACRACVVDTTGAGDAFNGGFLFALLSGRPARQCLRIANRVGALSTRMAGGIDGLPRRDEII